MKKTLGIAEIKMKIKECPCGKIPEDLSIQDIGQGTKWAIAIPTCCSEWSIEFKAMWNSFDSKECKKLAIESWNKAPRK